MDTFTHCRECGTRLRNTFFCRPCGQCFCSPACLGRHTKSHARVRPVAAATYSRDEPNEAGGRSLDHLVASG
jgi:hypothetical protein